MLLHVDEYGTLAYFSQQKMLKIEWTSASSKLRTENYTTRFDLMADYIVQYKPKYLLANFEQLVYKGRADFEIGIFYKLRSTLSKSEVVKFAFVHSADKLTALMFEPILNSKVFSEVDFKRFDSETEAHNWFNQTE